MVYHFSLEGNIGVGKTTILNRLKKDLPLCQYLPEPTLLWELATGENLIKTFYENPAKNSFRFQTYIISSFVYQHKCGVGKTAAQKTSEESLLITDRCIQSSMPFLKVAKQKEWISDADIFILESLTNLQKIREPDTYIYIRVSPSHLMSYFKPEEKYMTQEQAQSYLPVVHDAMDEWMLSKTEPGKVIVINNPLTEESAYSQIYEILSNHIMSEFAKNNPIVNGTHQHA